VAFSCVPLLLVPYLSVHQWSPVEPVHPFVGLANYGRVFGDPGVWSSLGHTLVYACSVPLSLALALGVALLLRGGGHRERRLATVPGLLLSHLASVVAIALVWRQLYHPDVGPIDWLLARAGLTPVNWLGDPGVALGAVIVVGVWMQFGYYVTLFVAALRRIPPSYLEAARVDGAGAWQRFWRVTFPLLRPVTLFALVTGIVGAFQVFTLVAVLTGGGPLHGTDVVVYHIYRTAWERLQFGEASAQALVLWALLLGAAWVQLKLLDRAVEYA
jgi:ABC-type sugar transport system permease subunit